MLRREAWRDIPPDTILDDVLIPMNVVMQGWRVIFDGRAVAYDHPSREPAQERARKVRTLAGNYQLVASHLVFLVPLRNPVFWRLVSHKLLRLAGPFLLATALAANAALLASGGPWPALLALQFFAYSVGLAGLAWQPARRWLPIRLAATFLALNYYATLAFAAFLRNDNTHLWSSTSVANVGRGRKPR
jgi:cellulose synthase/poly-beta-1,6-N-acetylglucosamine synthase-like glycosyltransferase